ncbi:hypothetical protein GCM10009785_04650 [Brooklawnia cerclae]|uniref:Uncharacterized protein n=1 Tax=Brooklawnia cerclae TaxID=349934 RepID=A0ABX0SF59_9ACTN|nr:hypothetical protein [Brooklawnia cerclae]NIH55943.1 hypothetical protein [Brooklawnia cerclae]
MVGTLIKHEWKRTRNMLAVVFGGVTGVVGLAGLATWFSVPVLNQVSLLVMVVAIVGLVLGTQALMVTDYWRSSYAKTGYFTQTLPIKGSTIYAVKMAWGSLVAIVAFLWAGALGAAAVVMTAPTRGLDAADAWGTVTDMWSALTGALGTGLAVAAVALVVLQPALYLVQFFFAVSFGLEGRFGRMGAGGPVITYAALYMVAQVVYLIGMFAVPLVVQVENGQVRVIRESLLRLMAEGQDPNGLPLGLIPPLLIIPVALVWRTAISWSSKISLR